MNILTAIRDGNDGPWSTFGMEVGTPPQNLRLLPSTSSNAVWPVIPQGCTSEDPSNCANLRGSLYASNVSSTWSNIGIYGLGLPNEWPLGYSANASFGYDNLTIGRPGDGSPAVDHQVIEGFAAKDFFVGTFGLSPHAVNLTDINDPRPSLLSALAAQNKIRSSSWAYTAGAYNRKPTSFGSLTLGGYDATRFVPNNLTFPFSPDTTRDLVVGVQSITSDLSATPLLSGGVYAFVDSLVPHIWLPVEVCQAFEIDFGLSYNKTAERYIVNDNLHETLMARNPNVTFRLGPAAVGGASIDIVMPYASFDLSAAPSFPSDTPRTFPLRQAVNDSQITLGRAFLQDSYIIADYERSNFSISQVIHSNAFQTQTLVSIRRPVEVMTPTPSPQHEALSKEAIGGISVAAALLSVSMLSAFVWYCIRRKAKKSGKDRSSVDDFSKGELDGTGVEKSSKMVDEVPPVDPHELKSDYTLRPELFGTQLTQSGELAGHVILRSELDSHHEVFQHELPVPASEMEDNSPATPDRSDRSAGV